MGSGIAQVAAQSGLRVLLHDISEPAMMRALAGIGRVFDHLVVRNKLTPETAGGIMANLAVAPRLEELAMVDLVIEAASELEAVKVDLFRRLNALCRPEAILASNTSSSPSLASARRAAAWRASSGCTS